MSSDAFWPSKVDEVAIQVPWCRFSSFSTTSSSAKPVAHELAANMAKTKRLGRLMRIVKNPREISARDEG
jgi:hypothetical protein